MFCYVGFVFLLWVQCFEFHCFAVWVQQLGLVVVEELSEVCLGVVCWNSWAAQWDQRQGPTFIMLSVLIFLLSPIWADERWARVENIQPHHLFFFFSIFCPTKQQETTVTSLFSLPPSYPLQNQHQLNVVKRMIDFRPMNSCCHSIASLYVLGPCTCLYFLHLYDTSSTYIFCCIMYVNFLFLL